MAQLEPYQAEFEMLGAGLVYIAVEKGKGLWRPAKYLHEHSVAFPVLLDEDRAITKAYGLYHACALDAFRIAHPATLVVDRAGVVRYIYRGADQTDRAPVDDVLLALRGL